MTQEQALVDLYEQLRSAETSLQASIKAITPDGPETEAVRASEDVQDTQRTRQLRELCEETLATTQ